MKLFSSREDLKMSSASAAKREHSVLIVTLGQNICNTLGPNRVVAEGESVIDDADEHPMASDAEVSSCISVPERSESCVAVPVNTCGCATFMKNSGDAAAAGCSRSAHGHTQKIKNSKKRDQVLLEYSIFIQFGPELALHCPVKHL
jgi:hypothetical protein